MKEKLIPVFSAVATLYAENAPKFIASGHFYLFTRIAPHKLHIMRTAASSGCE